MSKPSSVAKHAAAKRAKKRNLASGTNGKRAPINNLDVLKALDLESARADKNERLLTQAMMKIIFIERNLSRLQAAFDAAVSAGSEK